MPLSKDDLQAIAQLLDIKLHDNNEMIFNEMERLHNIQSQNIDSISQKVDAIKDNKQMTDYLLQQVSDLKKRVDDLENKIA